MKHLLITAVKCILCVLLFQCSVLFGELSEHSGVLSVMIQLLFFVSVFVLSYTRKSETLIAFCFTVCIAEFACMPHYAPLTAFFAKHGAPEIETRMLTDNLLYSFLIQLFSFLCVAFLMYRKSKAHPTE